MENNSFYFLSEDELETKEPAKNWTVGEVKLWIANHKEDQDIALMTAISSNQLLWISSLYKNNDPRYVEWQHEEWWWLNMEIIYRAMSITEKDTERQKEFAKMPIENKIKFIEPFMNQHGFRLKNGWWIYNFNN